MQVFRSLRGRKPLACTLLATRGERFELGDPASDAAMSNLALASASFGRWMASETSLEESSRGPQPEPHRWTST